MALGLFLNSVQFFLHHGHIDLHLAFDLDPQTHSPLLYSTNHLVNASAKSLEQCHIVGISRKI